MVTGRSAENEKRPQCPVWGGHAESGRVSECAEVLGKLGQVSESGVLRVGLVILLQSR